MSYQDRKKQRTEAYFKYVHGWKLRKCTACNGSGYYDSNGSPDCGSCDGTGKERYQDVTTNRSNNENHLGH
jgi:DnaJ-class molecular chaperone